MPTLYVENVPRGLYEAIRKRAKSERRSLAAEVIAVLARDLANEKEFQRRRDFIERLKRLDASIPPLSGDSPTSDEMIREDRESR